MMTELEMSRKLGLILEPANNKVHLTMENSLALESLVAGIQQQHSQRHLLGELFQDLWLDFVPWHSDN